EHVAWALMNSTTKRILFFLALAGLVAGAVAFKLVSESEGQAATKPDKNRPAKVTVIETKPVTMVDELATQGRIAPHESVALKSEVAGRIEKISFEEHAEVEKGDLLLALDDDVLRARLATNRQQAKLAERTLERQQEVLNTGGVSQQSVDETKNRIAVLDAQRQEIQAELDNTRVRAPFDGRIGLRHVSPGDYVTPGSSIATLTMLDPVKVEFTVQARHVPNIQVGDTIEFKVDGRDDTYTAEIYASENEIAADSQTLTYAARADNESGELMPGAFADVTAVLERREDTLAIPAISLVTSGEETFTWVIEDGKAQRRPVEIGLRTRSRVEVIEGLKPGATIVVTGRQGLEPDKAVDIKTEDAFPIDEVEADTSQVGTERRRLQSGEYDGDEQPGDAPSNSASGESDAADKGEQ
ncbi:MAG: efflux RND transporter periplasmic adaptor subunit, partial [Myxococcota bacterium]